MIDYPNALTSMDKHLQYTRNYNYFIVINTLLRITAAYRWAEDNTRWDSARGAPPCRPGYPGSVGDWIHTSSPVKLITGIQRGFQSHSPD